MTTLMTSPGRAAARAPEGWLRFAAPQQFYPLAGRLAPWFAALAALLTIVEIGRASCRERV